MKYFNNHDIKVNECELPFSYTLKVHIIQFMHNLQNMNLGYQESIDKKLWIKYDVALITLDSPFDISLPQINPICLPKRKMFFDMDELYKEKLRIIGVQLFFYQKHIII